MDNLTHSLVAALLSQAGLKKLTGRATATLVIAANLPDIDGVYALAGTEGLAVRRGITHGPIAMLVLPLVLWGLMLAYDRWRPGREPVRPAALLLLAYIGILTHPALDWLNSYGIRLLSPFSDRWFAADTLFIVDLWLWGVLALAFTLGTLRERRGSRRAFVPARYGLGLALLYVGLNGLITTQAEHQGAKLVVAQYRIQPELVVANPVPIRFWARKILWRGEGVRGRGDYLFLDGPMLTGRPLPLDLDDPRLATAPNRSEVDAFLTWSRMPFVEERDGRAVLGDQRFDSERTRAMFQVELEEGP